MWEISTRHAANTVTASPYLSDGVGRGVGGLIIDTCSKRLTSYITSKAHRFVITPGGNIWNGREKTPPPRNKCLFTALSRDERQYYTDLDLHGVPCSTNRTVPLVVLLQLRHHACLHVVMYLHSSQSSISHTQQITGRFRDEVFHRQSTALMQLTTKQMQVHKLPVKRRRLAGAPWRKQMKLQQHAEPPTWPSVVRCMKCRRCLAIRILSVCLSVRLSIACTVTKRKKDLSRFLYHTKAHLLV